jgi:hypothetical protein
MRNAAAIDFDIFVSGDGSTGTRSDFDALTRYLTALVTDVTAGFAARRTVDELQATLMLEQHQQSVHYAQRTATIAEAYAGLRRVTMTAYGAAQVGQVQRSSYCAQLLLSCEATGGPSLTAAAGVSVSFSRVAVLAEMITPGRFTGHQRSLGYRDDATEYRDRLLSFLGRFDVVRTPSMVLGLSGGMSRVSEQERLSERWRDAGSGSRSESIVQSQAAWGRTIGIDVSLPVNSRIAIVLPFRFTHTSIRYDPYQRSGEAPFDGHWNAHAGIGLAVPVLTGAY